MKSEILIILSLLILTSCKISLKDNDLLSYNIYKVNDTLVFKNKIGKIIKFKIISKTIINKGWDENTGLYNPQVAYIKYAVLGKLDSIYHDDSFLTIYQKSKTEIEETIYFNGFIGIISRKEQKTNDFKSSKYLEVFKVPIFDLLTVRNSTDIIYIYWTDKNGIIGYDCKDGDRWRLVANPS